MLPRIIAAALAVFASSAPAQSCVDATCFGPLAGPTVVVGGTWSVASGAVLDFGPRHLILQSNATLNLEGPATILAAKISMASGARIDGTQAGANFEVPSVFITTTGAGGFDGDAELNGVVDLSGTSLGSFGWLGGSLVVVAARHVTLASYSGDAGDAFAAGHVSLSGVNVVVGSISSTAIAGFFSQGASVTIAATGDVTTGSIFIPFGAYGGSASISVTAGGDYVQSGALDASMWYASFQDLGLGSINIEAGGDATVVGGLATGSGGVPLGGSIGVYAGGSLTILGTASAVGSQGGYVVFESGAGDLDVSGTVDATADASMSYGGDEFGGSVVLDAARDLDATGTLRADNAHFAPGATGSGVALRAGGRARVRTGSLVSAQDVSFQNGVGGGVSMEACRVEIESSVNVAASGDPMVGGGLVFLSGGNDVASSGSAAGSAIQIETRLPAPFGLVGPGSYSPTPTHVVDPSRPPCLANFTASVATNGPIAPGATAVLNVVGPPVKGILAAAALGTKHVSLGAYGFTQVDLPFGAIILGDAYGVFGPPIPASTDALGRWTYATPTPNLPALSGLSLFIDVYVVDGAAANGLFHQPPVGVLTFL